MSQETNPNTSAESFTTLLSKTANHVLTELREAGEIDAETESAVRLHLLQETENG